MVNFENNILLGEDMKRIFKIVILICAVIAALSVYKYASIKSDLNNLSVKSTSDTSPVEPVQIRNFTGYQLINNDKSIPVLMYHSIAFEKGNELRVPKEKFREQMKFLKDNGYTTLSLDEVYEFFQNNKPIPSKSVVITFDDGYEDNYLNAYPVLKEFGFKATIFVITSTIDNNKACLNSAQLKEMQKNGIDIESHTVNHDELDKISYAKQLDTLKRSKETIENLLNKKVYYIAYPVGKWNNDTIEAAKQAGYRMAFTTKNSWSNKENGLYTLNRVRISASYEIKTFNNILKN